jgi:hypothetical protein
MKPASSLETCDKKVGVLGRCGLWTLNIPAGTGVESSLKISYQPGTGVGGSCSKFWVQPSLLLVWDPFIKLSYQPGPGIRVQGCYMAGYVPGNSIFLIPIDIKLVLPQVASIHILV